jgi:AmmeMemoRadiSam system protein A
MMDDPLTSIEKATLLRVARTAIENHIHRKPLEKFDIGDLTTNLSSPGASFVTLNTIPGNHLRGCIGALEAYQSLILDVQEHAIAAAFDDYRFSPVRVSELPLIRIEISRLTKPVLLIYDSTEDLLKKLRPDIDGVILKNGNQRATFLPQVWEKIESKESFLSQLCLKMGANSDLWKRKQLQVLTYQVEEFHE